MKLLFILIISLSSLLSSFAQSQTDTANVFMLQDLEVMVFRNHPIVKQAALLSESARANVMQSLGYFDPGIRAGFDRKMFGNKNYYNRWVSELKVPLWLAGADLKIGYDRNVGDYVNPETSTSTAGLAGIGLSIPLGQGLLIDSRRNTLRQAKIMVSYAEAERVKQINAIWYSIVKDYWNWYFFYNQFQLINEGLELAQTRFKAISRQTSLGDKASIDSVEAAITVQDRMIQYEKMKIDLLNARLTLSNHLWSDEAQPLELPEKARPLQSIQLQDKPQRQVLDTLLEFAAGSHPELIKLRIKGEQLAVERSYRKEMLKPKLNVSGSLLSARRSFNSYIPDNYDFKMGNYKLGFEFALPLFLRAERGKLKEVKIKQQELAYDMQQSNREIRNSVLTSYNHLNAYGEQLAVQVRSISNQEVLLNGESSKFDLGESTLFLINSRESKLIDMKIKREEMISGYQKTLAELYYKAGSRMLFHL
ncbi:outer membrane protein TolC [Pedobacter cryoconitis]|uniref:Outer membrane protein TolC n=1 Tax=Pedobacter cryoconitis TaxID=188932 RepID=A0A7W9DL16_9SPHI|nr:TolC family protein [Pedobacter cryoconitis]MBB5622821.1 outer membrane protein TolC [Pedobacter cryoconitis]